MGFKKTYTVLRTIPGNYNEDGYYVDGEKNKLNILATVQPIRLNEYTQIFPEGTDTKNAVKIYTNIELLTDKSTPTKNADVLLFMKKKYKIIACSAYQSGLINHFKAYAQEVK